MKKTIVLVLSLALCLSTSGCGGEDNQGASPSSNEGSTGAEMESSTENQDTAVSMTLEELMEALTKDANAPASSTEKLNEANFEQYSFIPWQDGIEAICSEAQILSQAHSLVLIKSTNGNTEELAKAISEKANMTKWICVSAEAGKVLYTNNYVLMIMSFNGTAEKITENFNAIFAKDNVKSFAIKSSSQAE